MRENTDNGKGESISEKQHEFWSEHVRKLKVEDVIRAYDNPAIFQRELRTLIESHTLDRTHYRDIIEVGCETGVVSMLLDESFTKTFLDLNPQAINLARQAADQLGKRACFCVADMFEMPFDDKSFDIVFNAGVIEHFNQRQRIEAIGGYARILRDGGLMFIGFPNHFAPPYRTAYLLRRIFNKWPYPKEEKLYDLKSELKVNGLVLQERIVISKGTVFNWLDFAKPLKQLFLMLDKLLNFEGYLTVLVVQKKVA